MLSLRLGTFPTLNPCRTPSGMKMNDPAGQVNSWSFRQTSRPPRRPRPTDRGWRAHALGAHSRTLAQARVSTSIAMFRDSVSFVEAMVRVAAVNELHTDVFGDGVPALFVLGSFGWGLETFPEQRVLANQYQVILIDRRGFGGSSSLEAEGWPVDMHDVAALLDDLGPAHLVGQSYGAVVALLAAGLRPERVRSLVAIEPPAFEVARGDADADATTASLKPVFDSATELTAAEFVANWARANGMPEERLTAWIEGFGDQEWAAADASRRERWPGDAPIQFDVLAAAAFRDTY
jgi:pimeloyl-ACP methyl ester carboxylesterase